MKKLIQTGIAAYGMSGKLFHAPFIQAHPGFNLNAIVERHKTESAAKYPHAIIYRSFEELIADKNIELIIINTPVQTHYEYAKAALMAGKHIIVEKPFTVTAAEAEALDKLAKEKNLFLSVYQNRRYDGDFLAIKDVVTENMLGELKEAELRFDRYRPGHSGKNHKEGDQPGAGNLHDLGAHLIDQAIQLFGFPESIFADIFTMRKGLAANDYFQILFYYKNPFRVRIKGTLFARETYYAYILHGENGSFLQQRSDLQEDQLQAGDTPSLNAWIKTPDGFDGILHTQINGIEINKPTRSEMGNYMNFYSAIYNALVHNAKNPVPAHDGVLTMRIIDAALQSNAEKKAIQVTHYNG